MLDVWTTEPPTNQPTNKQTNPPTQQRHQPTKHTNNQTKQSLSFWSDVRHWESQFRYQLAELVPKYLMKPKIWSFLGWTFVDHHPPEKKLGKVWEIEAIHQLRFAKKNWGFHLLFDETEGEIPFPKWNRRKWSKKSTQRWDLLYFVKYYWWPVNWATYKSPYHISSYWLVQARDPCKIAG